MTNEHASKLERLIDANLNRLKEGMRVIEDINRYIFDNAQLTATLKALRHTLQPLYDQERLRYRDIDNDVQKATTQSERRRTTLDDLIIANFSRAQEAARVLEESFKLIDPEKSDTCKTIRYALYGIEREFFLVASQKSTSNSK